MTYLLGLVVFWVINAEVLCTSKIAVGAADAERGRHYVLVQRGPNVGFCPQVLEPL